MRRMKDVVLRIDPPDWLRFLLVEAVYWLVMGPIAIGGFVLLAYGMAGCPPLPFAIPFFG